LKLVERYLLGQLIRPVLGVFLIVLVIILASFFSSHLAEAVVERFPLAVVFKLAALKVALYFDVLIPGAVFLGLLIGLGRLQAGYEITALASAGVGRASIIRPVLVVALIGLLLVAAVTHLFRPWAYATLYQLESEVAVEVDLERVEPGRFEIGDDQWMIFAEQRAGEVLTNVLVHQRLPTYRNILRAERLEQREMADGSIVLDFLGSVRFYRLDQNGDADLVNRTNALSVMLDPPAPVERERIRRALSFTRLLNAAGPLEWGEFQWRTVMPLSVVLLAFGALLLGRINPRHGKASKVVLGSVLVAVYFAALGSLSDQVDSGAIAIWPGLFWLPAVLVPVLILAMLVRWSGPGAPL